MKVEKSMQCDKKDDLSKLDIEEKTELNRHLQSNLQENKHKMILSRACLGMNNFFWETLNSLIILSNRMKFRTREENYRYVQNKTPFYQPSDRREVSILRALILLDHSS